MTHRFLLLLVVCTIVSTWNEVAIAQEIATPYHQTNTQRLLTNGVVNPDDVDDERGISMLSVRNIQTFFGRNSGLTKKLTNVHRSDGGVTAVEKNTAVSKMVTVLDKNPASLNKLVKDPNMIQVATSLNKQSGKFTKTDVSA
ncbi:RxLR effector protein, partial [Phytophthora megakarya]